MSQVFANDPAPGQESGERADRALLLDRLATQALEQVAGHFRAGREDPDGTALDRLYFAAIGPDPRACAEVARTLIADGLTAERICDVHIPAAARRMGEDWISDDLFFSAVTIGAARLQGLLRELDLDLERAGRHSANGVSGSILVVVAPGADHTLGALVLASHLRRRGLSVRLSLGEDPETMVAAMEGAHFDAVFLSATIAESLPFLFEAAAEIRAAMPTSPPLVLGGALVASGDFGALAAEGEGVGASNAAFAGIDHVTSNLDTAFRLCGLTTPL